ncbi:MAG TPA: GH3 auxin-responsive promoter family protein, partial [Spirochaetota bacterium]|nr:GH3 auxin-responsive promoter family protein [Spirochaetota bacterium]
MKIIFIFLSNLIFFMSCLKEYLFFIFSSSNPESVQKKILKRIIIKNINTLYAKENNFISINDCNDFRNLKITSYEDYSFYLKKCFNGEKNILTKDNITLFEPTSGSSGSKKFIPYNNSLKNEFNRAIKPWITNI